MDQEPEQVAHRIRASRSVLIAWVFIIAIVAGGGGFLVGLRTGHSNATKYTSPTAVTEVVVQPTISSAQDDSPSRQQFPSVEPTPILHPTVPIARWKAGSYDALGVSFQYPDNWYYTPIPSDPDTYQLKPVDLQDDHSFAYIITITFITNDKVNDYAIRGNTSLPPVFVNGMSVPHLEDRQSTEPSGSYYLNKSGRTVIIGYYDYKGFDYGKVAEDILRSITFQN